MKSVLILHISLTDGIPFNIDTIILIFSFVSKVNIFFHKINQRTVSIIPK